MPNHCSNIMRVSGSEAEVQRFRDTCIKEKEQTNYAGTKFMEEIFDFNSVVPMPDSLHITSGGSVDKAIAIIKARWGDVSDLQKYKDYDWVIEKYGAPVSDLQVLEIISKDISEEQMAEGQQALDNLAKYGHKDWYDWCVAKWGTKWGAYNYNESGCETSNGETIFSFVYTTAWSPGSDLFFETLGKMFPDLTFVNSYLEEGEGFGGRYTIQGDDIDEFTDVDEVRREDFGYEDEDEDEESEIDHCPVCNGITDTPDEMCWKCKAAAETEEEEAKALKIEKEKKAKLKAEKKKGFDREALSKVCIVPEDF